MQVEAVTDLNFMLEFRSLVSISGLDNNSMTMWCPAMYVYGTPCHDSEQVLVLPVMCLSVRHLNRSLVWLADKWLIVAPSPAVSMSGQRTQLTVNILWNLQLSASKHCSYSGEQMESTAITPGSRVLLPENECPGDQNLIQEKQDHSV